MIIHYNAKRFFNVTQFSTKCYPPHDLKAINFALTFVIVNLGPYEPAIVVIVSLFNFVVCRSPSL